MYGYGVSPSRRSSGIIQDGQAIGASGKAKTRGMQDAGTIKGVCDMGFNGKAKKSTMPKQQPTTEYAGSRLQKHLNKR